MDLKPIPIKRKKQLIPLSREHHHALLLGWKINAGLSKNVEALRIEKYVKWFFINWLEPHFNMEEKYLFPILPSDNLLRQQAEQEHSWLREKVKITVMNHDDLKNFSGLLLAHVRFEERELFQKIQEIASGDQLDMVEQKTNILVFCDNDEDEFWLTP